MTRRPGISLYAFLRGAHRVGLFTARDAYFAEWAGALAVTDIARVDARLEGQHG